MDILRNSVLLLGAVGAFYFAACASQSPEDDQSSTAGAGGMGPVFSNAGTGSGPINPGYSGPYASSTPDGTKTIDSTEAKNLLASPENCQGIALEVEAQQSVIEFVVDVSGSMTLMTASTGGQTKWERTRAAVRSAVTRLPPTFGVGMKFYPNLELMDALGTGTSARPTSACIDSSKDVPIAAASADQIAKVQAALDGIVPYRTAATPTHDAYDLAVDELKTTLLAGKRYIVLITDGQPTQRRGCIGNGDVCNPEPTPPIVASVAAAAAEGIDTFIVGSPGSESSGCPTILDDKRGWLSEAARFGNTGAAGCSDTGPSYCHFDVSQATDFGSALSDALENITKSVISCGYDVPLPTDGRAIDTNKVNMIFTDGQDNYRLLLPNETSACEKGWNYTDASKSEFQICGPTCDLLQNNPMAKLTILVGCTERVQGIL